MKTFLDTVAAIITASFTRVTLAFTVTAPATAADISIALGAVVTSIGPHYHNLIPNNNVAEHVFETRDSTDARTDERTLAHEFRPL